MSISLRFDGALMFPPVFREAVDPQLLDALQDWCEGGAFPVMSDPLRIACIAPDTDLDGPACALDGSHRLARLGRWRGLAWRLQLLWRERVTARGPRPDDPWDCGWWRSGALDAAQTFRPRRPTMLMVRRQDGKDPAIVEPLLSTLRANAGHYRHPLRVVVVTAEPRAGVDMIDLR